MNDEKKLFKILKTNNETKILNYFDYLYMKYKPYVAVISSKYLNNSSDIDDVIQEVFIEFFNKADSVKSSIKGYLAVLTKNRSIDLIRKKNKITLVDYEIFEIDTIVNDNYVHRSLKETLNELKNVLSKQEVEIILLHLLDGLTFLDISNKININEKTVKTIYYRALKKFSKRSAL